MLSLDRDMNCYVMMHALFNERDDMVDLLVSSCCIMVGLFDDCLDLPFLDAWIVIIRYSVGWF
jgi:hypothetical protein